jgi:hypothetical protein
MSGILRIAARLVCTIGDNADNNPGYYCNVGEQAHSFFLRGFTNRYQLTTAQAILSIGGFCGTLVRQL